MSSCYGKVLIIYLKLKKLVDRMHTLNKVIIWNPYCIERSCELVFSTTQNGVFARLLMRKRAHRLRLWVLHLCILPIQYSKGHLSSIYLLCFILELSFEPVVLASHGTYLTARGVIPINKYVNRLASTFKTLLYTWHPRG